MSKAQYSTAYGPALLFAYSVRKIARIELVRYGVHCGKRVSTAQLKVRVPDFTQNTYLYLTDLHELLEEVP